jgi:hydrogenase nickel incorporation protein HypA/HybF
VHELSIATALIEQVEDVLARQDGDGLLAGSVCVRVGTLSGVDEEALRIAFPVAAEGTRADGAELRVETVEAEVHCNACDTDTSPDFPFFVCENCGSSDVRIVCGRELLLQSIEMNEMPSGATEGP